MLESNSPRSGPHARVGSCLAGCSGLGYPVLASRGSRLKWLADYQAPPLDPGIDEALRGHIIKREVAIKAGLA